MAASVTWTRAGGGRFTGFAMGTTKLLMRIDEDAPQSAVVSRQLRVESAVGSFQFRTVDWRLKTQLLTAD
jgi:hypothetical protein